jgi:hypothetical protein
MSIDAEEAAIRTVIVGALMGHSEAGERGFDALLAMRQAEAIVKALKIGGYEIKRVSRWMPAARFTDPIEPMDFANMRQNGERPLAVQCHSACTR